MEKKLNYNLVQMYFLKLPYTWILYVYLITVSNFSLLNAYMCCGSSKEKQVAVALSGHCTKVSSNYHKWT